MFRAVQGNQFDDAVGECSDFQTLKCLGCALLLTAISVKATDENLTSENWELILDVCDKVSTHENGYVEAIRPTDDECATNEDPAQSKRCSELDDQALGA